MVKLAGSFVLYIYLIVLFNYSVSAFKYDSQDQHVYVVYMGSLPSQPEYTPTSHHMSILQEVTGESSIDSRLVRSFTRSFNGFAAKLTESERGRVASMEGVVSVFPNKNHTLQTTSSWDFMGLKEGNDTKRNLGVESDTIIGVLDSGVWPESESFSDNGYGPPPKKWKGVCSGGKNFTCNNKLIGARDYTHHGARDHNGHGTHTASTAAGNAIVDTSFYGLGRGTVRGGVPASRIAIYNVCPSRLCLADRILSAFDDAIADGVDLITISIGEAIERFTDDPIAIGAFHAMTKGILTVNAASNDGPKEGTISSLAPWIFTAAASNTNRAFFTKVVLGDGKTVIGRSVNSFDLNGTMYPMVYGKSAVNSSACSVESAERCERGCLQKSLVKDKIVLCNSTYLNRDAQIYGAIATITLSYRPDVAYVTSLPATTVSQQDINSLISYVKSESSPVATILKSEAIFNQTAPVIASFSSRGPNTIAPDILKPDVTAPGVEILAAYSQAASPSKYFLDTRRVKYSVLSGTSMACPHVAGVAAYVKTFHPQWSPSMIKSAIMTTAWSMNASETGYASTEFAYGAGHVDPIAAINPGLVYDSSKEDYIAFLCGMNYNETAVKLISGEAITCTGKTLPRNLNYPSMSAKLSGSSNSSFVVSFNRTVTNVGTPISTYKSRIVLNHGSKLKIEVSPSVMSFKKMNEMQSFTLTVSGNNLDPKLPSSAKIIWSDGTHNVRSPIVVY